MVRPVVVRRTVPRVRREMARRVQSYGNRRLSLRNYEHYLAKAKTPFSPEQGYWQGNKLQRRKLITETTPTHFCGRQNESLGIAWLHAAKADWEAVGKQSYLRWSMCLEDWKPSDYALSYGDNEEVWAEHMKKSNLCPHECGFCLWKVLTGNWCTCSETRSLQVTSVQAVLCNSMCPSCTRLQRKRTAHPDGWKLCPWTFGDSFSMFSWGYINGVFTVADVMLRLTELDLLQSVMETAEFSSATLRDLEFERILNDIIRTNDQSVQTVGHDHAYIEPEEEQDPAAAAEYRDPAYASLAAEFDVYLGPPAPAADFVDQPGPSGDYVYLDSDFINI